MPVWSDTLCAWTGRPIGYYKTRHLATCPACRYAQRQYQAAQLGFAEGQCDHCGQWRADGRPPVDHPQWCTSPDKERWGLNTTVRHIVRVTDSDETTVDPHNAKQRRSQWVTLLGRDFSDPM